jgi:hypothetical protein
LSLSSHRMPPQPLTSSCLRPPSWHPIPMLQHQRLWLLLHPLCHRRPLSCPWGHRMGKGKGTTTSICWYILTQIGNSASAQIPS